MEISCPLLLLFRRGQVKRMSSRFWLTIVLSDWRGMESQGDSFADEFLPSFVVGVNNLNLLMEGASPIVCIDRMTVPTKFSQPNREKHIPRSVDRHGFVSFKIFGVSIGADFASKFAQWLVQAAWIQPEKFEFLVVGLPFAVAKD